MPDLDLFGWIIVGFLAGWLSGVVVGRGGPRGCLADTVVGILGGLLGGWFGTSQMHRGATEGFLAALLVAFLGAAVLRLLFDALGGGDRNRGGRPGNRW